jgi:pre-mRNA-processing factor 40
VDVLQLIYEDQIDRMKEKELKEAKKRQRLGDNFLDLLYSIKVSILVAQSSACVK